jgi:hypothetical protein
MQAAAGSPWNSLEVAKLAVSVLTPAAIAVLGIYIHRITKRFEDLQWRGQKLTEKRLQIYDDLAPLFNDLLCYFTYVGPWKELKPPEIVALKRKIDRKIFLAAPLFPREFFSACQVFQGLCFRPFSGWGMDAQLRTNFERRRESDPEWLDGWERYYADTKEVTDPAKVRAAYSQVMQVFSESIGVTADHSHVETSRLPRNIR